MMKRVFGSLAIFGTLLGTQAQPVPKINSISHEYAQRGTSVQVTLTGENLSAAAINISGDPGLSFSFPPPEAPAVKIESAQGGITTLVKEDASKLTATLTIAPDAPVGVRELRASAPGGISNPLNITITHLSEIAGDASATSLEKAQLVTLPAAINGRLGAAAETDFYKFAAKKGQRIIFDALAQRIGSAMDTSVIVTDKNGRELARNEDAIGNDSVLEFLAPEDGDFVLQIRDYRMQGGDNFRYRLLAGALPYVTGTFPLGGRRGETTEVELRGSNLEGAEKLLLHLDAKAPTGQQELRTTSAAGLSNPFPFLATDLPQVMEQEPNTSVTHANEITLPAAINGRIQNAKDYDAFRFHVERDQRFIFDVIAQKFGSPLDALLTLTDANGNVLQRNDDAAGPDARIDQTFATAGDYYLYIEDLLERGGPTFTYRIHCAQPKPDFEVRFISDTPRVLRGGRVPVRCELSRANGFGELVRITARNLGSGLHAEPLVLTPNDPEAGFIFITAGADAPLGSTPLQLEATGIIGGRSVTHAAKPLAGDRPVKQAFVTVLEQTPFLVHSGQLLANVEQDQTVNLDALIERRNGFNGEIKISLEGFSAGRDPVTKSFDYQPITLKGNESRGSIPVKAKLESEIGARLMVLRGESTLEGQLVTQFSAPFPVATTQIPFVLSTTLKRITLTAVPPGAQSSAGEAFFLVRADRRAGFEGEITLQLEGTPEGITVTADKMAAGARESSVKLVASEKAVVGKDVQLTLTGVGVFKDKTYRYKPQPIALLVNAPEPIEVKTAEVKPAEVPAGTAK